MLPLAVGLSLAVGAAWWAITLRQETSRPSVLRDNGREWVVGSETSPILPDELSAELRSAITETLRTGRLALPPEAATFAESSRRFARRRSKPNAFRLHGPFATAVPDVSPRFSWTPVANATAYRIHLQATTGDATVTSAELPPATTEWVPATGILRPGAVYGWKLQALRDGQVAAEAPVPPEPEARFRVLEDEERRKWEGERSTVGDSNLLRGIVAARAGLLEEAATEFRALGRQNPRAERARIFLEQVDTTSVR